MWLLWRHQHSQRTQTYTYPSLPRGRVIQRDIVTCQLYSNRGFLTWHFHRLLRTSRPWRLDFGIQSICLFWAFYSGRHFEEMMDQSVFRTERFYHVYELLDWIKRPINKWHTWHTYNITKEKREKFFTQKIPANTNHWPNGGVMLAQNRWQYFFILYAYTFCT